MANGLNNIFGASVGDDPNGPIDLTAAAFGAGFAKFSDGLGGPSVMAKAEVKSAPIVQM